MMEDPPDDFPNADRPEEIWMNLRLDLETSRARLNNALDILVELHDYGRAAIISKALNYHYQALYSIMEHYRERTD